MVAWPRQLGTRLGRRHRSPNINLCPLRDCCVYRTRALALADNGQRRENTRDRGSYEDGGPHRYHERESHLARFHILLAMVTIFSRAF